MVRLQTNINLCEHRMTTFLVTGNFSFEESQTSTSLHRVKSGRRDGPACI